MRLRMAITTLASREFNQDTGRKKAAADGPVFITDRGKPTHVLPAFAGRLLPIDGAIARRSARLHVPDPRPYRDGLLAATALIHGLTVVTRNGIAFAATGVPLLNPWTGSSEA